MLSIKQQCEQIALHPSRLNRLNKIIETALNLDSESFEAIQIIIQFIAHFPRSTISVKTFIEEKLNFLCLHLLQQLSTNAEIDHSRIYQYLLKLFLISHQNLQLVQMIVDKYLAEDPDTAQVLQLTNFNNFLLLSKISIEFNNRIISATPRIHQKILTFLLGLPSLNQIELSIDNAQEEEKKQFQKSYQQLTLNLIQKVQKSFLVLFYRQVGEKVLSKFSNPLILAQHCLQKFTQDSETQIEILSCLFILVGKYGLELQQFYPHLQELILKKKNGLSVYQLPNSRRFFKLVESSLRSSKVQFKVILALTKIIISQLPSEQSNFSYWALSFLVNLTKKHRKLLDYFHEMPEIDLLKRHYSARIRSLVKQLSKDLNKIQYLDIQQFSKIKCQKLAKEKVEKVIESLKSDGQAEFKIISIYERI